VRRLIATVAVTAQLSISGSAALQHVHAYGDHDHAEHHHGLAAHVHTAAVHHHDEGGQTSTASIEACEPGAHAVSVVFTYVAPQPDHAPVSAVVDVFAFVPALTPLRAVPLADVRAHSPPRITDAPLRAPPLVIPA
jgi:hypothetical protein